MAVHDWTRVEAGIFHAFHHGWVEEIARALNRGILPESYYALPEQQAAGFGPDVLTLQSSRSDANGDDRSSSPDDDSRAAGSTLVKAAPRIEVTGETEMDFYRRKQAAIAVRHVSGDHLVAIVEIVSPANKSSRKRLDQFLAKASHLLDTGIHLLIIDVLPPGKRDPKGIHAVIWDHVAGQEYELPAGKLFTLAAYETDLAVRAFVKHVSLGEALPDMPLFLERNACVETPLEQTYLTAFAAMPKRWRTVLERSV